MNNFNLSILSVGRFDDLRKDIKKLIKVISIFCKRNIKYNVVLNIVSPKSIFSSKNLSNIKNLQVKYHTDINDEKLEKLYIENDIYFSSSIEEGFGFVIIDAIKYNCLVVSTRTAGSKDILGIEYPLMANNFRWYSLLEKLYLAIDLLPIKEKINKELLNSIFSKKMIISKDDSYSLIKKLI